MSTVDNRTKSGTLDLLEVHSDSVFCHNLAAWVGLAWFLGNILAPMELIHACEQNSISKELTKLYNTVVMHVLGM